MNYKNIRKALFFNGKSRPPIAQGCRGICSSEGGGICVCPNALPLALRADSAGLITAQPWALLEGMGCLTSPQEPLGSTKPWSLQAAILQPWGKPTWRQSSYKEKDKENLSPAQYPPHTHLTFLWTFQIKYAGQLISFVVEASLRFSVTCYQKHLISHLARDGEDELEQ